MGGIPGDGIPFEAHLRLCAPDTGCYDKGMALPATHPVQAPSGATRERRSADVAAISVLLLLTVTAEWRLLVGGTQIGLDAASFFYPVYSFLGERLRSGHIPAWNPYQLSGVPFAADPQSGWMYLPAMLLFTFLPLAAAAKSYMFLHPLLAGLAVYALARALRMNVPGALLAAVAYAFTGFMTERNICCFVYTGITAWLPIAILSMELAIRNPRWLTRAVWWGAGGLALSQILAVWLGQGSYYALLALGGYTVYRALIAPPESVRGPGGRMTALVLHGGAMLLFAFGLSAAGLIPRLEYNALSNLAGGYSDTQQAVIGGWNVRDWTNLLIRGRWYAGGATLVLATVAIPVARARFAVPYFATLSLASLVLARQGSTPLHAVLYYVLPGFARIHPHSPERVIVVFYLGTALMAGAILTCLSERDTPAYSWRLLLYLLPAAAVGILHYVVFIPTATVVAVILANLSLAVYASGHARQLVGVALLLLVAADLLGTGHRLVDQAMVVKGPSALRKVDLDAYYALTGSGQFLQSKSGEAPSRYFGYDPPTFLDNITKVPYRHRFTDMRLASLLVNNRSIVLGLQDIQGYNPVRIARYDQFIKALNRRGQDYRSLYVFDRGLTSPLLNLLNARYVVVPAIASPDRLDLQDLISKYPTRYQDSHIRVLENTHALPRAWIVHSARQVRTGEALKPLTSGLVDPRKTVLLEQTPPSLVPQSHPSTERSAVSTYEPEHISLRTETASAGMLVLSEPYYPAWKAYVDGRRVPIYVADHVFRAIPLPPGRHRVDLRYESWSLRIGIGISLVSYTLLLALWVVEARNR